MTKSPHLGRLFSPCSALILLAAALAIYPLLPPGIPSTADGPLHLIRLVEFDAVLRSGVLYPRWAPDLAYGYGYPLFNFYAPLFYYVAEIPHLLGASFVLAFKLTIFLTFCLYGLATFWWTRPFLGDAAAVVAGVAYVYVPFRFHEAYMQGDYPQFLALGLAPLAFGALYRLFAARRVTFTLVLALALSSSAILLVHNISTLWLAPTLVGYGVVLAAGTGHRASDVAATGRAFARLVAAAGIGILAAGLTAFFWLPALAEQNLVQLYRLRTDDYDVRHSFITLATLLAPPSVVDQTAANPPPFLHLGWGQLALALATIPLLLLVARAWSSTPLNPRFRVLAAFRPRVSPSPRGHVSGSLYLLVPWSQLVFGWLLLVVSASMTLPLSTPVWRRVPLLGYTQFPWRVLELSGLATALLAGIAVRLALWLLEWQADEGANAPVDPPTIQRTSGLAKNGDGDGTTGRTGPRISGKTGVVGVALLVLVVPSLVYLYPRQPFLVYGRLSAPAVTAFERNGGAVGTTSTGEYYPLDVQVRPTAPLPTDLLAIGRLDRTTLPAGAVVSFLGSAGYAERYAITLPRAATLRFDLIRFAGWQVEVDGQQIPTRSSPGQGLLLADAPAGAHRLTLNFVDTPVRRTGWILALASALVLATYGLVDARRAKDLPPFLVSPWGLSLAVRGRRAWARWWSGGDSSSAAVGAGGGQEASSATTHPPNPLPYADPTSTKPSATEPFVGESDAEGTATAQRESLLPKIPGVPVTSSQPIAGPALTLDRRGVVALGAGFCGLIALRITSPAPYAAVFARQSPLDRVVGVREPARIRLEDQVEFLGYDLSSPLVPPGGQLIVTLYWRALVPLQRDYRSLAMIARVGDKGLLTQDDRVSPGGIPTHTWPTDRYFVDEHTISIPANAPPMVYQLQVALYDSTTLAHLRQDGVSGWQGEQIVLRQVHVTRPAPVDPTTYQAIGNPVFGGAVTLLGYRLSSDRLKPGQTLDLTLIWRGNRPLGKDYTVFTHLIDANQKQVAGADSVPLNGQYPTSTWLAGEDVVDPHAIALPATLAPGQYHLAFGLYDARTLERLDATEPSWNGPRSQIDLDDRPIRVESGQPNG